MNKNIKNIITALLLFIVGFGQSVKAQGVDVIFMLDNSSSIDNTEWTEMSNSVKSIMDQVLDCNTANRAAVVHYGTPISADRKDSRIYIESDFTDNITTLHNFGRRTGLYNPPYSNEVGHNDYTPSGV